MLSTSFFLTFILIVTPGMGVVGVEALLGVIVLVKLLIEYGVRATPRSR